MKIKTFFIFTFMIGALVISAVHNAFELTSIDLSKSQESLTNLVSLKNDLKIKNKNIADVFIARKVWKVTSKISTNEPITLKRFDINIDTQPVTNLLAHYRSLRETYNKPVVNTIPSLLVRTEKKPRVIPSNENLAEMFTDFKRLKSDLFSPESFSKRIVLAENDTYTSNNKPFSKYISKGIPGLKKKETVSKKVEVVQAPDLQQNETTTQKINIKQSSSLKPLIEMYEARNKAKASSMPKAKKVKEVDNRVTSQITSQRLLNAIKAVNNPKNKMDTQRKNYEINNTPNPLVIDMSKIASSPNTMASVDKTLMSKAASVASQNELFGELALKKDSSCIQPYVLNSLSRKKYKSSLSIAADSFMLDKGFKADINDFYIEFSDTYNDIHYSNRGLIEFKNIMLSNRFSVRRGTIYKSFHYPTVTDLVFENDDLVSNIPLVEINSMAAILKELPQMQFDAHALIELDQKTEDVKLVGDNSKYIYKFYLNDNMKVVKPGNSDYTYIFLTNIKPGNYFLEYEQSNGKRVSKIVHIESQKVYFDSNYYVSETKDQFALYENDLLTKCAYEVDLESNRLVSISDNRVAKKINTNNYQYTKTQYPLGTRKYYEVKYSKTSLYIGRQDTKKVVIPSKDYVDYLYDQFNINSLNGMCIIQLNLNKRADAIKVNMTSPNYAYDYDLLVLDQDGLFYKDFTANSNRVFILGTEQGVANIKLDYIDGSVDYIQSYCSDNTYLVEEL